MTQYPDETTIVWDRFTSDALADNPLGDPAIRRLPVLLPPNYDPQSPRRYPVLYGLSGYLSRGASLLNDAPWQLTLSERLDRLYADGMPHVIVVLPDCFTTFGGSQYRNSSATGRYEDYLVQELVPYIDSHYVTIAAPEGRGVFGKSSGGYGALVLGMRHPDVFGALACHSGDMAFELCYTPDFPKAANGINRAGGLKTWWQVFQDKTKKDGSDIGVISVVGMAACYSPDPTAPLGLQLPFDLETCELREDIWVQWHALDPITMVEQHTEALRNLRLLYLDCGNRDEYHLHFGARRFIRRLQELDITHEYQEFNDGHRSTYYRYDVSLPKLAAALSRAE
ncbi:MAG: esterase [Chloroflexi bacterium AL-W]|nr:esterase [Chloroflexi bacterium AL-N1]NOK66346.1 esterase [Chloroflexi bacterium AL-N10]NOK71734.1 esterase [Chloroflexi bacterium AL-N5]NOK80991.1 esterase [Chloroflexi bacterium AL-W]NOK89264.1 esterase [Chloroflexi bacterium AL-N15]